MSALLAREWVAEFRAERGEVVRGLSEEALAIARPFTEQFARDHGADDVNEAEEAALQFLGRHRAKSAEALGRRACNDSIGPERSEGPYLAPSAQANHAHAGHMPARCELFDSPELVRVGAVGELDGRDAEYEGRRTA